MRSKRALLLATLMVLTPILGSGFFVPQIRSANLTNVSVTLSDSRLSFKGLVGAGNSAGSSFLDIKTSGAPSTNANELVIGQQISLGVLGSNSMSNYNVSGISDSDTILLSSELQSPMNTENFDVIATVSANLTVRFTTASAINNGSFRILVPAASADNNDSVPDQGGWDFNDFVTGTDLNCGSDLSNHTFSTGTHSSSAGAVTLDGQTYHEFICDYNGTGDAGQAVTFTISNLINPTPNSTHTVGTADTHRIIIQHRDSTTATVDSSTSSVGTIGAVRVIAEVPATIDFSIAGVASGTTSNTCGVSGGTDVTTTASEVNFGTLSLTTYVDAAQTLSVTTNGDDYAVTVAENDQLGLAAKTCTGTGSGDNGCILDATGETAGGSVMSHTQNDDFDDSDPAGNGVIGFAYALDNDDVDTVPFQYNVDDGSGACANQTFCAKQFADLENSETAQEIMAGDGASTTVSENLNVCYRIVPDTANQAGSYSNYLVYTATATF